MPPAKYEIRQDAVADFLSRKYSGDVLNLRELHSGKHSRAFSYEFNEEHYIIRFNTDTKGFLKDKYAYEHFVTEQIAIPKVLDTGLYQEGVHYCVTEQVFGETARDQYKRDDFSSLPLQYEAIEAIAKIKPLGNGFGDFDVSGNAPFASSLEYIQLVYRTQDFFDWMEILVMTTSLFRTRESAAS